MTKALAIVAAVAAALVLAGSASADQPFVFGPIEDDIQFSFDDCGFEIDVALHAWFENRIFENPQRNINYIREVGTATNPATGKTALIRHSYTEIGRPPTSPDEGWGTFEVHGLSTRVIVPGGGGVVLIDAGYLLYRYPDGHVFVEHGNHQLRIEGDRSELCAALAG